MRVFYRTILVNADDILASGFRDAKGGHTMDRVWYGVWVSDKPFDRGPNRDSVLLVLDVPRDLFDEHEWKRAGLGFRQALIPADVLNRWGTPEVIREG